MAVPRCAIDVGLTVDVVDDVATVAPVLVVRIWLLFTDITRATTLFLSKLLLFLPFKCAMARRGMWSEDDVDDDGDDEDIDDDDDDVGGDAVVVDAGETADIEADCE